MSSRWSIQSESQATSTPMPTYLDTFLPKYEFRGTRSAAIHAQPDAIFRAFREISLDEMPWANFLGQVRYLPERLAGRSAGPVRKSRPFLDTVLEFGNAVLVDEPNEFLVGVIGKLHQVIDQEPVHLHDARDFLTFSEPGYQKLAQGLRIDGTSADGTCIVTFEHRTHALSPQSRRQFSRYWLVIRPTSFWLLGLLLGAIKSRAEGGR